MANIFGYPEKASGGDFVPIIKYTATDGHFSRVDRVQDQDGNFVSDPVDITENFKCVADLENVETGWMRFMAGTAPSMVLVKFGEPYPPEPADGEHKPGVRFMLKLAKNVGGDVRELTANSKAFLSSMSDLIPKYLKERASHPGKLPVLVVDRTIKEKSGKGLQARTNYCPIFKIVDWVDRPADLVFVAKSQSVSTATAIPENKYPPQTGATSVPPPQANGGFSENVADDFG